jgi:tRNA U34 2-thiouridine synthase MnmA/TrmU
MRVVALLSGGLDSIIATKLILDQGIEVVAVTFILPVTAEKRDYAGEVAKRFGIPLVRVEAGEEYLDMVRNPKHGYGSGMNPCIDCRIYMLREAKRIAKEVGADFIFTGDVLGERPMSQHRKALELEEKEAGLERMVLRPLSAKLLPDTIPEREGWVDRNKLCAIKGKSRKPQIALANKFGIPDDEYPTPSGGCLLTYREFASKLRDLFDHNERATMRDVRVLKIGRHFRFGSSKIIVGRNEAENKLLLDLNKPLQGLRGRGTEPHSPEVYVFEVPDYGSPITILEGEKSKEAIEVAAKLTARYSDAGAKRKEILVEYRNKERKNAITVLPLDEKEVIRLRV